ncbi:phosphoserine phosphatase [Trueperella bonasi]|uniref:phosphoserine phosphatase n=1 Tax=Trueperella bonasi TaxID=312286 RepID=A0ABT9NDT6_9ACTO|nr:phosphoserine phosphatase SerB [Trueperella bonasi]MDP9805551.1 phosphoserine phosphatase [Trueperella bonasi]
MKARFSVVSPRPIPGPLIAHVRQTIAAVDPHAVERGVKTVDLDALTWLFDVHESRLSMWKGSRELFTEELRGPATALAVDSALITGKMAEGGPAAIVTDVDSTFITSEVIEMLAARAGVEEQVREITEAAMRGELEFAQSLGQRVGTLAGIPTTVFDDVFAEIQLTDGAQRLVDAVHERGGRFCLVSGGFTEIVEKIAQRSGIDRFTANGLEVSDGALTGRTYGTVIDGGEKVAAIRRWEQEWEMDSQQVLCAGDGANDLPMMAHCGLGVAFMAKPIVLENADCAINFPRLDAIAALVGWDIEN